MDIATVVLLATSCMLIMFLLQKLAAEAAAAALLASSAAAAPKHSTAAVNSAIDLQHLQQIVDMVGPLLPLPQPSLKHYSELIVLFLFSVRCMRLSPPHSTLDWQQSNRYMPFVVSAALAAALLF